MNTRSLVPRSTFDENVATTVVFVRVMLCSCRCPIDTHPAFGVSRVRSTVLPAIERAAITTARKRSRPTFSSVMRGLMLTAVGALTAPSNCAWKLVFDCGCTWRLQLPPLVVVTFVEEVGSPEDVATTVTSSPACLLDTVPESVTASPRITRGRLLDSETERVFCP